MVDYSKDNKEKQKKWVNIKFKLVLYLELASYKGIYMYIGNYLFNGSTEGMGNMKIKS